MDGTARLAGPVIARLARSRAPVWIAAHGLHADLSVWLARVLGTAWPQLRWDCTDRAEALQRWQVDLWLVDSLPDPPSSRPVLWLCGPERHTRLTRVSPLVWELPAPILRRSLVAAVETVIASGESA